MGRKVFAVITKERKRQVYALTFLFAVVYMISYMTRINFGAVVAEMETATGISRQLLSMSLTGSFITYGAGQIVSGVAGDRVSPKKLVTLGLSLTTLMNMLLPLCQSPWQMLAAWCVNGFAQSFLWPPIIKLMTALLDDREYQFASTRIYWGSSVGTILIYLVSPLLISLFSWKATFWFSAVWGVLGIVLWNLGVQEPENICVQAKEKSASATRHLFAPMMIGIMGAIVMMGMLRDGITTWMPTYIADTYRLSNIVSILTGVILPLFSILCVQITGPLYRKKLRNPLLCTGAIFGVGAVSALLLFLCFDKGAAVSVLLAALLTGSMHGVNYMLVSILPSFFRKYGNTSTASGILNACTYIGSALSTYGIALLSKGIGWSKTVLVWVLIAMAGTALCFVCIKPWTKEHPVQ